MIYFYYSYFILHTRNFKFLKINHKYYIYEIVYNLIFHFLNLMLNSYFKKINNF